MSDKIKIPLLTEGVDVRVLPSSTDGGNVQSSYQPKFIKLASGDRTGSSETILDMQVEDMSGIVVEVVLYEEGLSSIDYGSLLVKGQVFGDHGYIMSEFRGQFQMGGQVSEDMKLIDDGNVNKKFPQSGGGYCILPFNSSGTMLPYKTLDLLIDHGDYLYDFKYTIYGIVNSTVTANAFVPITVLWDYIANWNQPYIGFAGRTY